MENVKSKPFFVINNTYASNFTLHDILFILESFVLFAKRLLYQNFSYSIIWEVSYVIYFFQFLKPFPDGDYLVKTMETWVCEICKICMKTSELNVFKVNNKSTRTRCCSGVLCLYDQLQRCRYWGLSHTLRWSNWKFWWGRLLPGEGNLRRCDFGDWNLFQS